MNKGWHRAVEGGRHKGARKGCLRCHRAYMREWRKTHPMTLEENYRDKTRSYANVYKRRGKLEPRPCEICGAPNAQMHHADYDKPLQVRWLCASCHRLWHKMVNLFKQID